MATGVLSERVRWVVETLAVAAGDHLLEIGCGRGAAVEAICGQLTGGRIVAIDRSAAMIRIATQRNTRGLADGRAEFRCTPLATADLTGDRFDKVFAVNVNLFWVRSAEPELEQVRRALKPTGTLYLFYEPPGDSRAKAIAERVSGFLTGRGFRTRTLLATRRRTTSMACVVARPLIPQTP